MTGRVGPGGGRGAERGSKPGLGESQGVLALSISWVVMRYPAVAIINYSRLV